MSKSRARKLKVGLLFRIPLADGESCFAQVASVEPMVMNSIGIVLFDQKGRWESGCTLRPCLSFDMAFSNIHTTRDLLNSGRWAIVDGEGADLPVSAVPYEALRASGFIGARVYGSAIVEEFANAFYGLVPWDDWYIPDYLDQMLISPDKKPRERLIYSGRHS